MSDGNGLVSCEERSPYAPRSASSFPLSFIALLAGLAVIAGAQSQWPGDPEWALLCGGGVVCAVIAVVDLAVFKVNRRSSTGLAQTPSWPLSLADAAQRFLGLLLTLMAVGLAYWLLPEYRGGFYQPYWHFLRVLAWPVLCSAPLYFLWIGQRLEARRDAYLKLGGLLLGRGWREIDAEALRSHALTWGVKAFFLPLMVVYLERKIASTGAAWRMLMLLNSGLYDFLFELTYLIDLLFCVLGYLVTLRVLDTHVRSTDRTVLGWGAALICYQPFYAVLESSYVKYDDSGIGWEAWVSGHPVVHAIWGAAIIALSAIYALSTVSFGLRFSNLTNRGIITSGPYRFLKHPAYISKNLSWWLISVPFISHAGGMEAVRHCALLLLFNGVYFVRARTEERHLSQDPAYQVYSSWIRENGVFSKLRGRLGLQVYGPTYPHG